MSVSKLVKLVGMTGLAVLSGQTAQADVKSDLGLAVQVCLATIAKPGTRESTFAKYGFAVTQDDEWGQPDVSEATKGDVFVSFDVNGGFCQSNANGLPLNKGGPMIVDMVDRQHGPLDQMVVQGCDAKGLRVNGAYVVLSLINQGNDIFCYPSEETRIEITTREF